MPEIARGFPSVRACDPHDETTFAEELAALVQQERRTFDVLAQYRATQAAVAEQIRQAYAGLRTSAVARPRASVSRPAPRIVFVVPHFNQSRWLPALWSSLCPQLRSGDEAIIVDDASSPEEARAARAFAQAGGLRFVALPTNRGPSAARNAGVQHTTQELLYFIDADDELFPDSVDALREAMRDDPGLDAVSGFMRAFGDENHCWASYDPSVGTILREHTSHCGVVVRRETFARVGGYEERVRFRHWEDWEFHIRLVLHGARFEIIPRLTYRYRVDKSRGRNSIDLDRIVESHEALLRTALASVPAERLPAIWAEISALLVDGLLKQAATTPVVVYPDLIRYKVVDSLNELMRRTPLHAPLKRVFGWRWRLQQPTS
jgi:glycosyltransferase involved in cell wall biosynthesis